MANKTIEKAVKDGIISRKQADNLSEGMVMGLIKKKRGGTKKGEVRKTARRAYEPKKPKGKGVKEVRHKIGKEKGKVGRPKKGSEVKVEK
jgi:hypothetical protein|tara:strand:+ start:216 stop:485 length:270 start_codon:yes stop_codon:yes gene_type:complete